MKTFYLDGLSGSALKVIALLSMVSDHLAYFFVQQGTMLYDVMRCFGRIAFPIFAFLIAEGFAHTRNRRRYLLTLLAFAIISEMPWLCLMGDGGGHNVMFTLAMGVIALQALIQMKKHRVLSIGIIALIAYIATRYHTDYEWHGVCMIVIFYLLRERSDAFLKHWAMSPKSSDLYLFYPVLPWLLPFAQVTLAFPLMAHYGILGAIMACMIILMYNGERGFIRGSKFKYAFYAFYPAHLLVIWLSL